MRYARTGSQAEPGQWGRPSLRKIFWRSSDTYIDREKIYSAPKTLLRLKWNNLPSFTAMTLLLFSKLPNSSSQHFSESTSLQFLKGKTRIFSVSGLFWTADELKVMNVSYQSLNIKGAMLTLLSAVWKLDLSHFPTLCCELKVSSFSRVALCCRFSAWGGVGHVSASLLVAAASMGLLFCRNWNCMSATLTTTMKIIFLVAAALIWPNWLTIPLLSFECSCLPRTTVKTVTLLSQWFGSFLTSHIG